MLRLLAGCWCRQSPGAATRLWLPPFSWQIPVLASPGLSCSDSVPAVVVVREGGGRGRGERGDKTWCCILEQASAGHTTWGIWDRETERNVDITELQSKKKSLGVKWPSCVWSVSKVTVTSNTSLQISDYYSDSAQCQWWSWSRGAQHSLVNSRNAGLAGLCFDF